MTTPIVPSITEDQLINLDCCDEYGLRHMHAEVWLLIDSYRALQERLRAAEKDAARYRWFRDPASVAQRIAVFSGGDLDKAVDAAMEHQP